MQACVFPRTSGARNPIVIVRIFIFLQLKVVLQAKPCKGGWCNAEGWSRLRQISQTQKNYIYLSHICPICKKLATYTLQLDLKNFTQSKNA